MSESRGPGGKPPRVPVHYFPKKVSGFSRTTQSDGLGKPTQLLDLPLEEAPTEAGHMPDFHPGPAPQRARPEPAPKKEKKSRARPEPPRRSLTPVSVDTDPALNYHKEKLTELLASQDPVKPFQGLGKKQLVEMSLFGHHLFEMGRLDEARVVFEGIVGLGIEDAFPHTMLGTIYLALDRQDRALALFEAALTLDGDDIAARVYRGELRLNAGKVKPAMEDLFRALDLGAATDPFVERARRLIGIAQKLKHKRKR